MIKLVIPLKLTNWNDIINANRINKFVGAKLKKREMGDISYFARNIPKIEQYPIKITFIWHITNTRSDLDNKSVKAILDCMQNLGKIENDNIAHINQITHKAIKDKTEYIEMIIENNS